MRGRLLGPPKSQAGQRTIALDTATIAVLRAHQHRQHLMQRQERRWLDTGLVFTWPDGHALSPDWLTHRFHYPVTQSGLPPVRLYGLRHGAATMALAAHTDVMVVQPVLGHSSYAFTADAYTSPTLTTRQWTRSPKSAAGLPDNETSCTSPASMIRLR
jgi:integrase